MVAKTGGPARAGRTAATALWVLLLGGAALLAGFGLWNLGALTAGAQAMDVDELLAQAQAADQAKQTFADGLEAGELYKAVLERDPDNVQVLLRLAALAYWLGEMVEDGRALPHLEAGLQYAERAAQVDDTNADAHYWRGVLMGRIGEERGILQSLFMVPDIMRAIERALALDPEHDGAHLLASQVYRKAPGWPLSVGNRAKAVEHALEAVRLNPDATSRVLNLAEAYLANRQRDEAIETLRRVLEMPLTPGDEALSQRDKERAAQLLAELGG